MMGPDMPVRLKDIAEDLGISVVTVSKALRNQRDIGAATRRRVLKRAKQLGYQPNWVARSLVTRKTYMIGLVVPDLMHSFFAEIARGVARTVRPAGYSIVICESEEKADIEEREIEHLMARQVDGLIVASAQESGRADIFRRIADMRMPYVLADRLPAGVDANFVGVNDETVGSLATEHLIAQGCRRIAHIRGQGISTAAGRLSGYRAALARHRLDAPPSYVVDGGFEDDTGYQAMRKLLRSDPLPDGVFCYNDPVAMGAIRAILEAGLRIPDDIAVVGAGNVHYSDLLMVPLTTVDQGSTAIGEHAAKLLLDLIQSKRPRKSKKVIVTPKLIVRQSSDRNQSRRLARGAD